MLFISLCSGNRVIMLVLYEIPFLLFCPKNKNDDSEGRRSGKKEKDTDKVQKKGPRMVPQSSLVDHYEFHGQIRRKRLHGNLKGTSETFRFFGRLEFLHLEIGTSYSLLNIKVSPPGRSGPDVWGVRPGPLLSLRLSMETRFFNLNFLFVGVQRRQIVYRWHRDRTLLSRLRVQSSSVLKVYSFFYKKGFVFSFVLPHVKSFDE